MNPETIATQNSEGSEENQSFEFQTGRARSVVVFRHILIGAAVIAAVGAEGFLSFPPAINHWVPLAILGLGGLWLGGSLAWSLGRRESISLTPTALIVSRSFFGHRRTRSFDYERIHWIEIRSISWCPDEDASPPDHYVCTTPCIVLFDGRSEFQFAERAGIFQSRRIIRAVTARLPATTLAEMRDRLLQQLPQG